MSESLSYPIGRWRKPKAVTPDDRAAWIQTIADLPARIREAVAGLDDQQLDTPYRPGGWTVRQLIHHVADSHVNAYCRFRLTLTEDAPTIRTYEQEAWAELPDAKSLAVEVSLGLLETLHARWSALLSALDETAFARRLHHPEGGELTFDELLSQYAWHSEHHTAHVTALREREGW